MYLIFMMTQGILNRKEYLMTTQIYTLIAAATVMFLVIGGLSLLAHYYTLNGIKSRTVGDS